MNTRRRVLPLIGWLAGLLALAGPATLAFAEGKIPRAVIDQAAAQGVVLVLVGLNVPWQMEAQLNEGEVRAQRAAIATAQDALLAELAGKQFKIVRRYEEVPGIALEVGVDALAELARSATVVNVLLDRPAFPAARKEPANDPGLQQQAVEADEAAATAKVPSELFRMAARDGSVLVLAGLRAPWQREEELSDELLSLQRKTILHVQSYILAELAGTRFRVMRLYRSIPGIALRVGPDALKVLENSPAVTNVVADRPPVRAR